MVRQLSRGIRLADVQALRFFSETISVITPFRQESLYV